MAYPTCDFFSGWIEPLTTGWDAGRVRQALAGYPDLARQPDEFQSEHKISYFADDASPERIEEFARRLSKAEIKADLVYSSRRDLDVLPAGVNKGAAAAFLAQRWEIPPERVLVCGNSANDAALFIEPFRGVVVANAHEELRALAGERVYLATQPFALGVLEGLQYWLGK
jgi:sucrose-6F-phosphate phosphohydrolase